MLKNGFKAFFIILLAFVLHRTSFAAEVIQLPPEELAKESVLPIFDAPVSVRNRNVVTEGKIDIDVFYGYAMTEPIADVSKLGVGIYYHYNEDHAFGLFYTSNMSGLSDYAKQIQDKFGIKFDNSPMPKSSVMGDYNLKAFYGKMSLTKSLVLNTVLYGSGSLGMIQYENKSYPAGAIGMGQKFYFNKDWALRFDLRLYMHQGPVPVTTDMRNPSPGDFKERMMFTTNLDVGLSYLF